MVPTNEFLPFCPTDTGTNLLNESDYTAAADRVSGNKPGVASSKLNNKAMRQATVVAAELAQYISNTDGVDVLDDADTAKLLAQITNALTMYPPKLTKYTGGSGTFNLTYIFQIASGSATAGATYTNNSVTYTVVTTVASGVAIKMTGNGAPTASGTLTKASGTGDATLVFRAYRAAQYIRVRLVGGGGGGSGSGTAGTGGAGGTGGDSSFGTSLLLAGGGTGGVTVNPSGAAGTGGGASLGTGPVGIAIAGGGGGSGGTISGTANFIGGIGGSSALGGAGFGPTDNGNDNGGAAAANSGSGGGGGATSGGGKNSGCGGGSGGFIDAIIAPPASSYAYAVGAQGAAGTAGTGGAVGGAGAAGLIEVTEYYQ